MDFNNKQSDTDSEDDSSPKVKRKRATRRIRTVSTGKPAESEDVSNKPSLQHSKSHVYSTQVEFCQKVLKGDLVIPNQFSADSDVDEETWKPRERSRRKQKPEKPECSEYHDLLSDDEDLVLLADLETPTPKRNSPSPPPTPPTASKQRARRTPRRAKALTKAIRDLDRVQKFMSPKDSSISEGPDDSLIVESSEQVNEITVRVRSRSGIQRFTLDLNDGFDSIFKDMAGHEGVPEERVVMFLNDQTVHPYDTAFLLNLHVADIIECHVRKPGEVLTYSDTVDVDDPDVVMLQVQGKDPKSKLSISIRQFDPLERLMREYAAARKVSYDSLLFQFDGEFISPQNTAQDLAMEDDDCIDVIGL